MRTSYKIETLDMYIGIKGLYHRIAKEYKISPNVLGLDFTRVEDIEWASVFFAVEKELLNKAGK